MPVEYCLAAASADPPLPQAVKCVYADGTELVTGPPPGECPVEESDPRDPFCGGACGRGSLCPKYEVDLFDQYYGACVGLSDERPFGVCAINDLRCTDDPVQFAELPDGTVLTSNDNALLGCESAMGAPCVCLQTLPAPGPPAAQQGFAVLASVCKTYAAHFPDTVRCLDRDWNPVP